MSNSKFLLSFLFFFLFFSFGSSVSSSYNNTHRCSAKEGLALLMFKQSLSSINFSDTYCKELLGSRYYPIMMNWKRSSDCCKWDGVTCNHFTGDVIALDLSCGMLQGNIHPNTTLFHLLRLQRLNLASNDLTDSKFLQEIGRFPSTMTHLNISHCRITGEISSKISFFPNLVSLDLSWNGYDFRIQPYVLNNLLQNSTHLRELVIAVANISWVLPTCLNISSPLKVLDLEGTYLQGKLPNNIYNLPFLEKLDLSYNYDLNGSLPEVNKSTSSIPLKWLDLSSGEISESMSHLKFLNHLGLSLPKLSSRKIRDLIGHLKSLNYLHLSSTNLSGEIPVLISHLKSLNYLDLSSCQLTGPLPKSFINLKHLTTLRLSSNMLSGSLPSFLFTLPSLQNVFLSGNMFSGCLPLELFNCQSLKKLSLRSNQLDGEISVGSTPSFDQLTNLTFLDISYNKLTGLWELDTLLSSLPNLTVLSLLQWVIYYN